MSFEDLDSAATGAGLHYQLFHGTDQYFLKLLGDGGESWQFNGPTLDSVVEPALIQIDRLEAEELAARPKIVLIPESKTDGVWGGYQGWHMDDALASGIFTGKDALMLGVVAGGTSPFLPVGLPDDYEHLPFDHPIVGTERNSWMFIQGLISALDSDESDNPDDNVRASDNFLTWLRQLHDAGFRRLTWGVKKETTT